MLSKSYTSRTTARQAGKSYAQANGLNKFILIVNIEKKQFFFSDEDKASDPKQLVFARFQLIKGKWRDKTPLGKITCSGSSVVKTEKFITI